MAETCTECGEVHEMIRVERRGEDGVAAVVTVGELETSATLRYEGFPVYCGMWMQEVLCLRRQLAHQRKARAQAERERDEAREALANRDEVTIPQLRRETRYKCYCCDQAAGPDGVCAEGCACARKPSWRAARKAAEAPKENS